MLHDGRVGVAVLGCGRIGSMHADLLAGRVPQARLTGVFDVEGDAASAVGARLGVSVAATVDELVEADGVDAVAICTSTDTHVEMIVRAAAAGRHVFCEKPIALDLDRIDAALHDVERAGVALHVGFNRRFDPAHRSVRDAIAKGEIGDVHLLRITSRDPAPPPLAYLATSGGLFLDMSIHDFDMARFVTGSEVVDVTATGTARDPAIADAGDIDTAAITLIHENGCITTIDNSRRALYGYDQRVEAFGSGGLVASENAAARAVVRRDASGAHEPPMADFFLDRYATSFVHQWEDFVGRVADRRPPSVTGLDGRAPLVLGLAARRSLDERRTVPVAELDPAGDTPDVGGADAQEASR